MKEEFLTLLKDLPISINNLADPSILKESTKAKLDTFVEDRHTGPIALITKGDLSSQWWKENLQYWSSNLNLIVFASISHLPKSMEPAPTESRYKTLITAKEAGAKTIAYVRPIIHTINDDRYTITSIFNKAKDCGVDAIVSSGFRGDSNVVQDAGISHIPAPDNQEWMKTLKLTSKASSDFMVELAASLNIPYWNRTQCAVSYLLGKSRSINPYYVAPNFVGCSRCPLQSTCEGQAQWIKPIEGSVELLDYLGFDVQVHTATERYSKCPVEIRSQCTLCCTNCPLTPNMGMPYINIRTHDGKYPSWGEMSLARFLTGGMLATDPSIPPGENSNIRLHSRFNLPSGSKGEGSLYAVNSWLVWSEYLPPNKCLKCSYCFLSMFKEDLPPALKITVGMSPSRIFNYIT